MMCLLGLVLKVPNEVFCLCLMIEYIIKSPSAFTACTPASGSTTSPASTNNKAEGRCPSAFPFSLSSFTARSRRISLSTGTLTHSDAATKNAMPTMRFTLICSWYTTTASAVARMGLTR